MTGTAPKGVAQPAMEADLLALPDEGRGFELLDGEIVEKQGGFGHGLAQGQLFHQVAPYARGTGGGDRPGGWWIIIEQLVRFESGQTLRPDVAGWRRERLAKPPLDEDAVIDLRPDWICEIISSSNPANDLVKKRRIYHQHQVPHYWIVDPRDESLTVHRWTADGYTAVLTGLRNERVRPEPFEAVEWLVGVLFGDDDDAPR
jgi:Uma2 family endonuclease